jgi:hypothetical protein
MGDVDKKRIVFLTMQRSIVNQFRKQGMTRMQCLRWLVRANVQPDDMADILIEAFPEDTKEHKERLGTFINQFPMSINQAFERANEKKEE